MCVLLMSTFVFLSNVTIYVAQSCNHLLISDVSIFVYLSSDNIYVSQFCQYLCISEVSIFVYLSPDNIYVSQSCEYSCISVMWIFMYLSHVKIINHWPLNDCWQRPPSSRWVLVSQPCPVHQNNIQTFPVKKMIQITRSKVPSLTHLQDMMISG